MFNSSLPFSRELFEDLFDYLDEMLEENGCDDTLKYTSKFLKDNNLCLESSIEWMKIN